MSKVVYKGIGRLPANVTGFYDIRGKVRYRFRKSGCPAHYFKAEPGTPEFDSELAVCRGARGKIPKNPRSPGLRRDAIADAISRSGHWNPKSDRQVYFIASTVGPIKIGLADCAKARLVSLQANSPVALEIAAATTGGPSQERQYHKRFAAHRLHGEWFAPHPEILAEIARLTSPTTDAGCV